MIRKMIDYMVLTRTNDIVGLVLEVKRSIKQGWEPIGGIAVSKINNGDNEGFAQALVKYETVEL